MSLDLFWGVREINTGIISVGKSVSFQIGKFKLLYHQGSVNCVCQGKIQNIEGITTHGNLAIGNLLRKVASF